MGLILLVNSLAQQVAEITAVANLLSEGGVNQILLVWLVDSVLILITMGLQSLIIDRFNRISFMRWIIFGFAISFGLLRLLYTSGAPTWLSYALLYLIGTQQLVFFPMMFWVLANDIFDLAQATRLFPIITSFGFLGRLFGIGISLIVPFFAGTYTIFKPEGLIVINAGFYLLIFGLIYFGMSKVKLHQAVQTHASVKETFTKGWDFVKEVPAFRYLAISIIALLISDAVIEFRFLVVSNNVYPDPLRYQNFYATYRLVLTIGAILLQTLFTSRVIASMTIKNTFFIKPFSVLVSSLWMLLQSGLISAFGGALFLRLSQNTIDEPTRKAFQSLVPDERRGRVSIFMESYLYFAGTFLGVALTGAIVWAGTHFGMTQYHLIYMGVSLVASLLAIWAIAQMRRVYDSSLLNWRLKRRQRGRSSVLDKLDF